MDLDFQYKEGVTTVHNGIISPGCSTGTLEILTIPIRNIIMTEWYFW